MMQATQQVKKMTTVPTERLTREVVGEEVTRRGLLSLVKDPELSEGDRRFVDETLRHGEGYDIPRNYTDMTDARVFTAALLEVMAEEAAREEFQSLGNDELSEGLDYAFSGLAGSPAGAEVDKDGINAMIDESVADLEIQRYDEDHFLMSFGRNNGTGPLSIYKKTLDEVPSAAVKVTKTAYIIAKGAGYDDMRLNKLIKSAVNSQSRVSGDDNSYEAQVVRAYHTLIQTPTTQSHANPDLGNLDDDILRDAQVLVVSHRFIENLARVANAQDNYLPEKTTLGKAYGVLQEESRVFPQRYNPLTVDYLRVGIGGVLGDERGAWRK